MKRELIVRPKLAGPPTAAAVPSLNQLLVARGVTLQPVFPSGGQTLLPSAVPVPPHNFYWVDAPDDDLDDIADDLVTSGQVDAAYVKPAGAPPTINAMAPSGGGPPSAGTPDFTNRQGYLGPSPKGVDAQAAWRVPGGKGNGCRIVDLEWGWDLLHEDHGGGSLVHGNQHPDPHHGTAVIGVINAPANGFGVTGIAPQSHVDVVSFSMPTASAIWLASQHLRPGDIMLLEIHRPGPRHHFASRRDQLGYVAVEWWEDDFVAIQLATQKGIIVVEAAGNGAENLDDARYDTAGPGFPTSWTNPYRRSNRDSGAILVGAGAPPSGTHGRHHDTDRSRLDFSNYGASLDAQGWGREVTTTGYGDLQAGADQHRWYTDQFSGTSSASPMVVGALAAVQGVLRASGRQLLTPATARRLLRATGSPQTAGVHPSTQRIGNRPDLAAMIAMVQAPSWP